MRRTPSSQIPPKACASSTSPGAMGPAPQLKPAAPAAAADAPQPPGSARRWPLRALMPPRSSRPAHPKRPPRPMESSHADEPRRKKYSHGLNPGPAQRASPRGEKTPASRGAAAHTTCTQPWRGDTLTRGDDRRDENGPDDDRPDEYPGDEYPADGNPVDGNSDDGNSDDGRPQAAATTADDPWSASISPGGVNGLAACGPTLSRSSSKGIGPGSHAVR